MGPGELKIRLKEAARRAGFDLAGVAPAAAWPPEGALASWLERGLAGEMAYMAHDPAARADVRARFPWARSVLVVGLSYRTGDLAEPPARRPISRYAWGDDYHDVMTRSLRRLKAEALALGGGAQAYYLVDTGAILERAGARAGGIGWIAKNTMLIHERAGSYVFLCELVLPYELEPDRAAPGRCGTCSRCLDACPTRAFVAPYVLDARLCISYLTIELRGPVPRELRPLMGELVFGCDICQEVCPWNEWAARREPVTAIEAFRTRPGLTIVAVEDFIRLLELDDRGFAGRFRRSPIRRAKRGGLARNVCIALGNRGDPAALPALARALSGDEEPLVRGHAAWAIGAIASRRPESRPTAFAALGAARGDPDSWVREEVELALSGGQSV